MKDYLKVSEFFKYFIRKPKFSADNKRLASMHIMNRIAIVIGVIGVGVVIYKNLF